MIVGIAIVAVLAYGAYRLWNRTNALGEPAIVTPTMDAAQVVSPSLRARFNRLLHANGTPPGPRPKLIALTFDDGPYPIDTPLLLDRLAALHVSATFFLIGRDGEQYPELVHRIAAQHHEIANHTLTHPNLDQLSDGAVEAELAGGASALQKIVDDPALRKLMRPPHGRYRVATLRVAQRAGYDVVLWNDDPGDWRVVPADVLGAHVLAHATAPEILLLHSGRRSTIDMLEAVVARYRAAGYEFLTVGQLLSRVTGDQLNHPVKVPLP